MGEKDMYEEYSWEEKEETAADSKNSKTTTTKSGQWIATQVSRNPRTKKYGGRLHVNDGSLVTLEVRRDTMNLFQKVAEDFIRPETPHSETGNNNVTVINNNAGGGDSKKPTFLGTKRTEYSLPKGTEVCGLGHIYLEMIRTGLFLWIVPMYCPTAHLSFLMAAFLIMRSTLRQMQRAG